MKFPFGRVSVPLALLAWGIYVAALLAGGLDPPQARVSALSAAVLASAGLALAALGCAAVAFVVARQRVAAGFGLALALLFVGSFTGWLFVPLAWFR